MYLRRDSVPVLVQPVLIVTTCRTSAWTVPAGARPTHPHTGIVAHSDCWTVYRYYIGIFSFQNIFKKVSAEKIGYRYLSPVFLPSILRFFHYYIHILYTEIHCENMERLETILPNGEGRFSHLHYVSFWIFCVSKRFMSPYLLFRSRSRTGSAQSGAVYPPPVEMLPPSPLPHSREQVPIITYI